MTTVDTETLTATALERLRALTADPAAEFRPGQLEAIRDVVADRARVLCVQRTGWGKSAVYFVATALLREVNAGPTLIVSPLLALMRNQIAAAQRLGLSAHTINSTNRDEWGGIRDRLADNSIDLLLISPERLNNPRFRDEMLPLFAASVGLLVIDEAHCISDWGHDFRPDYRRVRDMLDLLPTGVAVLGTTATANDRVVADVTEQLAVGCEPEPSASAHLPLRTYRGPLARTSLRLEVVDLPRPAQRLAWLAEHLPELDGSGIVYTLTKRDADQVAAFLNARGISALAYSGDQDTTDRVAAEDRLLANEVKAICATSALGMGYDKSDLSFVVHYQAPGSVVAYYQQVGRAGRGVDHADVVLLRGVEDRRIQDFFIEQSFPSHERVTAVLEDLRAAGDAGRSTQELLGVVNIGRGRLEAMLKILDVEGALRREGSRWAVVEGSGWTYDGERYAHVTALRREEQRAMERFGADGRCLMRVLQEELDDPEPQDCGRCAVCTAPRVRRAARSRAGGAGGSAPALGADRARGQEDGARRVGIDAQDPRRRPGRAGVGAGPLRGRRLVAGGGARPALRDLRERRGGRAGRRRARRRRRSGVGRLCAVGAAGRRAGAARLGGRRRARRAGAVAGGPCGGPPAAVRDGQRRAAGGQCPGSVPRGRAAAAGSGRAAG